MKFQFIADHRDEFAITVMCRVLGADDYSFVVIDHPISSATSDDLTARAERAAAACVEQLIAP